MYPVSIRVLSFHSLVLGGYFVILNFMDPWRQDDAGRVPKPMMANTSILIAQ